MAAATPSTIGAPALDVARLFERLPAELRATVTWTRKPIFDALSAVLQSPGSLEVLDAASRDAMKPMTAIMEAWSRQLVSPAFAVHRASLMSNLEADQGKLASFVEDPGAIDTLEWCLGFITGIYRELWSHLDKVDLGEVIRQEVARGAEETLATASFRRGTFALMAASEAASRRVDVEDAVTLINVAFLELEECRTALARDGFIVAPFGDETREQRLSRIDSYVLRIRETLTDREFRQFKAARLTSLRT